MNEIQTLREENSKLWKMLERLEISGLSVEYADGDCYSCCPICLEGPLTDEIRYHEKGCELKALLNCQR